MTVGNLIRELQKYPPDVTVKVSSPWADGEPMEVREIEHQPAVPEFLIEEYVHIRD